jgi:hypothetical protein
MPRPTLNKKGAAFLLGCSISTVKSLIVKDQLIGYIMTGDGWQRHSGLSGNVNIFFEVEDVLRLRSSRPKRKATEEREGRVEDLPNNSVIPTVSMSQAASRLGINRTSLWWRVRHGEIRAYVMNAAGTGWTLYGAPDAGPAAMIFFTPEDIAAYAPRIDPAKLAKRQRGKPGRPILHKGRSITIKYPIELLEQIDQQTSNRRQWLIEAAQEKLRKEGAEPS